MANARLDMCACVFVFQTRTHAFLVCVCVRAQYTQIIITVQRSSPVRCALHISSAGFYVTSSSSSWFFLFTSAAHCSLVLRVRGLCAARVRVRVHVLVYALRACERARHRARAGRSVGSLARGGGGAPRTASLNDGRRLCAVVLVVGRAPASLCRLASITLGCCEPPAGFAHRSARARARSRRDRQPTASVCILFSIYIFHAQFTCGVSGVARHDVLRCLSRFCRWLAGRAICLKIKTRSGWTILRIEYDGLE